LEFKLHDKPQFEIRLAVFLKFPLDRMQKP
jgi:hypothetical protein